MKKCILASALALAVSSPAPMLLAASPNGGTINFTGKVTETACMLAPDSVDMTVPLPTIDRTMLANEGDVAGRTGFVLNVSGCPNTKVSAAFAPDVNVGDNGNLDNTSTDIGGVTDAQVQLLDYHLNPINIMTDNVGEQQDRAVVTDAAGNAQLQYYAQYYAPDHSILAGDMKASVQFVLTYE